MANLGVYSSTPRDMQGVCAAERTKLVTTGITIVLVSILCGCKGRYTPLSPGPGTGQGPATPNQPQDPLAPPGVTPPLLPDGPSTNGVPRAWLRFEFPPPQPGAVQRNLKLWSTHYYVPQFKTRPGGTPIRGTAEQSLFGSEGLTLAEWCDLALQGSGRISTSSGTPRSVSFADRSTKNRLNCSSHIASSEIVAKIGGNRFQIVNAVYARPARAAEAIPFRTIAVDPAFIPHGSTVFVPSAKGTRFVTEGLTLTHDGYFFATDSGSAIIGNHIDLFTGTVNYGPSNPIPFAFVRSAESPLFDAQIVSDPEVAAFMKSQHRYGGK